MSKLNYLLVMPRFVSKVGEWYQFPLGLPYISASMKSAGFNVFTLNLNNEDGDIKYLLQNEIKKYDIDVVLTGGLIFEFHHIKKVLAISKSIKNVTTIVGGGIITAAPVSSMTALEFCDFGVIGEGEITIRELCKVLEEKKDVSAIKGIIYPPPPPLQYIFKTNPERLSRIWIYFRFQITKALA